MSLPLNSASHLEPVAIVGMAAVFPKSPTLKDYWRLLRRAEDGLTDIPTDHWNPEDFAPRPDESQDSEPDRIPYTKGGFIPEVEIDAAELELPDHILRCTDVVQLLAVKVCQDALEDAGYGKAGRTFNRDRTSAIIGAFGLTELAVTMGMRLSIPVWKEAFRAAGVEESVIAQAIEAGLKSFPKWERHIFPGLLGNIISGRVANRLDIRGTNFIIDAACASALSSLYTCMMELQTGRVDMALAGGVDTLNNIFMYVCFGKTGILSKAGEAKPFSAAADGSVPGEGAGILVLKRLSDAQRDGDAIRAVLRSVTMSSDGKSKSIYAPDTYGQIRAIRGAYETADVDPLTVGLMEAHGTGTEKGDPVEINTIMSVFCPPGTSRPYPCAVGSVKSQIGHTKAAAGIAGLIKVVLGIQNRTLLPTIKVGTPNPVMELEGNPLYLSLTTRPWIQAADHPRRGGVSAFAFGGCNSHAVVEEYGKRSSAAAWDGSVEILAWSTVDEATLNQKVVDVVQEFSRAVTESTVYPGWICARSREDYDGEKSARLLVVARREDLLSAVKTGMATGIQPSSFIEFLSHASGVSVFEGSQVDEQGIWLDYGPGPDFPTGLSDLCAVFPEFLDWFEAGSAVLGIHGADVVMPIPNRPDLNLSPTIEQRLKASALAGAAFSQIIGSRFGVKLQGFQLGSSLLAGPWVLSSDAEGARTTILRLFESVASESPNALAGFEESEVGAPHFQRVLVGRGGIRQGMVSSDSHTTASLADEGLVALARVVAEVAASGAKINLSQWEDYLPSPPTPPLRPFRFSGAFQLSPEREAERLAAIRALENSAA